MYIIVIKIDYTGRLEVNQMKYIINYWWYFVQQP